LFLFLVERQRYGVTTARACKNLLFVWFSTMDFGAKPFFGTVPVFEKKKSLSLKAMSNFGGNGSTIAGWALYYQRGKGSPEYKRCRKPTVAQGLQQGKV
jgi:hypothetical protein